MGSHGTISIYLYLAQLSTKRHLNGRVMEIANNDNRCTIKQYDD